MTGIDHSLLDTVHCLFSLYQQHTEESAPGSHKQTCTLRFIAYVMLSRFFLPVSLSVDYLDPLNQSPFTTKASELQTCTFCTASISLVRPVVNCHKSTQPAVNKASYSDGFSCLIRVSHCNE